MVRRYATFASSGPLKQCYATIEAESEHHIRQWMKLHFPLDFANLYEVTDFNDFFGFKEVFAAKLGHTN